MLAGKTAARALKEASRTGSQLTTESTSSTSILESLTELFNVRELLPPLSAVALQPTRRPRSSNVEILMVEEGEEDCVIEALRSAPSSLFREPTPSSSSSTALFPPLLEKLSTSDFKKQPTSGRKLTCGKFSASKSASVFSVAPFSTTSSAEAVATLTKVLSMLSLVFQRSPAALRKTGNYAKLLRLLLEHEFIAHAAEDMEELWRRCVGRSASSPSGAHLNAFTALTLYCDVLVLLACHSDLAEMDAACAEGNRNKAAAAASLSFSSFASPTSLMKLYALNQKMGEELTEAAAPPASLRRIVSSLTAFLIHCAPHLPHETINSALRDLETRRTTARANMAHMAFIAALPSACPAMSQDWQCRALEVVRQATLYDVDVHVAYCTDGPTSVMLGVVMAKFGSAMHGLLSIMSDVAWCYCTADALVHMCHAVGIYGGTWESYPDSYVNLVNFLHRALLRYNAAHDKQALMMPQRNSNRVDRPSRTASASMPLANASNAIVEANRQDTRNTVSRHYGPSTELLVDLAILGVAKQGEDMRARASNVPDSAERVQGLTKVPSFADDVDLQGEGVSEEERDNPAAYLRRCEADANSPRNFFFYLSLLAYVTSALPQLLNSFEELPLFFELASNVPTITNEEAMNESAAAGAAATTDPVATPLNTSISLFALCMDLLRANLSSALGPSYDHTSPTERQRRIFCEATVCLLCAFMCEFPHSIQRLELQTRTRHLVQTVSYVATAIVDASTASFQMKRSAYALLYRYGSAVESLRVVLVQLINPANWATLSGDAEYVQADLNESMELYKYFCSSNEDVVAAEMGRALVAVAEMPAGAFRCTVGGAATATIAVNAVFDLREVAANEDALFAAVTLSQLPQLFSRLGEAIDTLMQAQRGGCWISGGRSTWQSAHVAVWLLYKTVSLYRAPAVLTAAMFPVLCDREQADAGSVFSVPAAAAASGRRLRSLLEVCLAVLCDGAYQPAHREMSELLAATLQACAEQQNAQQAFQALRSTLSNAEVVALRETLLTVQRGDNLGTVSNVLRLEVWLAMVRWCPALFAFLFGPSKQSIDDYEDDSDNGKGRDSTNGETSSDNDAAASQPEKLPFAAFLAATIHAKEPSLHEKALALQVLRHTGLSTVVDVKDVAALLNKCVANKPEKDVPSTTSAANVLSIQAATPNPSGGEWEVSTLAAACITYINTAIAGQLAKEKGAAASGSADNSEHGTGRTAPYDTDARTPLRRPHLASPTPPICAASATGASAAMAARCKVLSNFTDTIDQLLRYAQAIMGQCCIAYERESRELDYEDVFEWLERHYGNMSGYDESLSASVVLPRHSGLWSSAVSRAGSTFGASGSVFVRHNAPTALATASSRFSNLHTSKAAPPLVSLSTGQLASFLPYHRLIPVGPAETRFFRGTGDDRRLNTVATLLDFTAVMAAAAEQLLWFSGVDTYAAGLFSKRTQSLLEAGIRAVVASRPNSPLLAPLLTRHVQHALRLARAAATVLESALGSDMAELGMTPSIQRVLLQLAAFVKVNRKATFLLVDAVPIVMAFPLNSLPEQAAVEELMRSVQAMLREQLTAPREKRIDEKAFHVLDTIVEGCTRYFGRQRTEGGNVDTVLIARLLPTLLQYAARLSQFIKPTWPECANAYRFAGVLECVSSVLVYTGQQVAVLGFISEETLLAFTRALGQFAVSSVYDCAAQRHRRLGLHVCWQAVLSLWCVIVSLRGPFDARASGWLPSLKAALESTPRFVSAVGVFPGSHGADRQALLVWELEEVEMTTRLAASLAIQDVFLSKLLTSVQAGFLFLQQPRLQQHFVVSLPASDIAASEGRRIVAAQAHALRNALTVMLKQPYYVVPRDGVSFAAFVFSPELLRDPTLKSIMGGGGLAERGGITAKSLVFSLDLLRQFTVRELQLLRRITVSAASAGARDRSPDVSRTSTGSVPSRESSVGHPPSCGLLGDGETVTDVDELYTADGVIENAADQQAIHLETVQLALNAYVLSVEDLMNNAPYAPGGLYTAAVTQTIRHMTERLLHTLRSLAREVRDLRRPLLSQIVHTKTTQLQAVLERL